MMEGILWKFGEDGQVFGVLKSEELAFREMVLLLGLWSHGRKFDIGYFGLLVWSIGLRWIDGGWSRMDRGVDLLWVIELG
jgi:hypothetical protein